MLIVCPSCATSYDVKPATMPTEGRKVRCRRCRTVWHAEPSHADKVLAAAAAIAPERGGAARAEEHVAGQASSRAAALTAAQSEGGRTAIDDIRDAMQAGNEGVFGGAPGQENAAGSAAGEDIGGSSEPTVDAPPLAPVESEEPQPAAEIDTERRTERRAAPIRDIETLAAQRQGRGKKSSMFAWPLSPLQTAIMALVLVDAIIIGWRTDLVRALPQTASFYRLLQLPVNFRGLTFDGVTTATEQHEGVPILVIEGNIVNVAHKTLEEPRLKFIVRNATDQEIYSWTAVPTHPALNAGDALPFRTRLASPPPDAKDILVRFVTRRDMVAGGH
jgi:predicted Zn finger-like uncharacterized protein